MPPMEGQKLERSIDAAQIQAAREAAKLIHQARIGLARADIQGTADWQNLPCHSWRMRQRERYCK